MAHLFEDDEGKAPLHMAAYYTDPDMVELRLDYGADPSIRDDFGRTALNIAVSSVNNDVVGVLRPISALG